MTIQEYEKAKEYLRKSWFDRLGHDPVEYIEALITVEGHAWCMDVASERKKMAKLICGMLGI